MICDQKFRRAFKAVAFEGRHALSKTLARVFELPDAHAMWSETRPFWGEVRTLPEGHPLRAVLTERHAGMPDLQEHPLLQFDVEPATRMLEAVFAETSFAIYDYDEPYEGGYRSCALKAQDFYPETPAPGCRWKESWDVEPLVHAYWAEPQNEARYASVGDFSIYADQPVKSVREQAFSAQGYKAFDAKAILAFHERLITLGFPGFLRVKQLSNDKVVRFARRLRGGLNLAVCVQMAKVRRELRFGYFELPQLHVEIFEDSVSRCLEEEAYLCFQIDHEIARIKLPFGFFMMSGIDRRMGSIGPAENADVIKRKAFYHSDVRAQYLNLYLTILEKTLCEAAALCADKV
jgi:hypothetical protein